MPALALAVAATAAIFVIGSYFFGGKDDDPTPPSHSGTRPRTQRPHRPPPPSPSYTYRPPATYAHNQATVKTAAPPDYGRDVDNSSYSTRASGQTQLSSASSDELAGVEGLELAKRLREKARSSGREMSGAYNRAKGAQRTGDYWAIQEHKRQADDHKTTMEDFDKRAAKIIFREKNKNRKEGGKIDLHGLYVAEAVGFANEQLQSAVLRGDEVVRFIVGKGLHSDAGGARIRPALEDLFTERGLDHSLDPHNAGVLIVQLD